MQTTQASSQSISTASSKQAVKKSQILAAAILGLGIVLGVGMLPMDSVHNAAHDLRHSAAFPCH